MPRAFKATAVAAAAVFAALAVLFASHHSLWGENRVADLLANSSPRGLGWWALGLTQPTHFFVALGVLGVGALWVSWRESILLVLGLGGAAIANDRILKPLIGRIKGHGYAFPSGHASAACLISAGVVLLVYWLGAKRRYVVLAIVSALAYAAVVEWWLLSKRYHYPADVLGSLCYGILVAAALHLVHLRSAARRKGVSQK